MNGPTISFTRESDDAVTPTKAGENEVGFDLTLIKECKKLGENTTMYDTGICVEPSVGYYTEIVPRSSISKLGYVMANSIGIIDPTYRGSLRVCLTKVDSSKPDLTLPVKIAQLIIRPMVHARMIEVNKLSDTERGDGGFGSSDKK